MKYHFIFLINISFTLLFSSQIQANEKCQQWKKSWSTCSVNSDCIIVANPCGWPTSASNKLNSKEASDCNRIEGAAISCASWNDLKSNIRIAVCESGQCQSRVAKKTGDKN